MWNLIQKFISIFSNGSTSTVQVNVPFGNTPVPFNGTQLTLQRKTNDALSTEGELSINGKFFCYTIELPKVSFQGSNVRISAGTFAIQKYLSPHWGFDVPLLQNVPGRDEIEMHPSNFAINPDTLKAYLLGCIALGDGEDKDVVYDSKATFDKLMLAIDWTRPVQITVLDE